MSPDIGYNEPPNYFATEQYGKSIVQLRESLESGKQGTVTALMCCILFVCFDSLRGHVESSMIHLQSGLKILRSMKIRSESDKHIIENYLVPIFMRLSIQSILYVDTARGEQRFNFATSLLVLEEESTQFRTPFETLEDARGYLVGATDGLFRAFYMFDENTGLLEQSAQAINQFQVYREKLLGFEKPFIEFLARKSLKFNKMEVRGAALLKIHHTCAKVMTAIGLVHIDPQHTAADEREVFLDGLPAFETIVHMSRSLIQAGEEDAKDGSPSLAFSTDLGVIGPLYYVCIKCPSQALRDEAMKLLERAPRKEGMWDTRAGVRLIKEFWAYEQMHKAFQEVVSVQFPGVAVPIGQVIDLKIQDGMKWKWSWIGPELPFPTRQSTPDNSSTFSSTWDSEDGIAYSDLDYFFGEGAAENLMNYESWDEA